MNANFNISYDRDWTWINFPNGKPAESILAALRTFARFSARRVAWYSTRRIEKTEIESLLNVGTVEETAPTTPAALAVIDCIATDPEPTAPQLPAPRTSYELQDPDILPEFSESIAARNWLHSRNLPAPVNGEVPSTSEEFYKYTVSIYTAVDRNGKQYFGLTTKSPQQKQYRHTLGTHQGTAPTLAELLPALDRFLAERERVTTAARERKAEKANARLKFINPHKVGDILVGSWGYDQTNIDWFQVLEVRPTALKIRKIHGAMVEGTHGHDCSDVVPCPDDFIENQPAQWVTIQIAPRWHSIPSPVHGSLSAWNGTPHYCSWYH